MHHQGKHEAGRPGPQGRALPSRGRARLWLALCAVFLGAATAQAAQALENDAARTQDAARAQDAATRGAPVVDADAPAEAAAARVAPGVHNDPAAPPAAGASLVRLGDDATGLTLGGAAQLRFTASSAARPVAELRRLRFVAKGRAFDGRLAALVQLSTTPASFELVDWWAAWRFGPWLTLRAGAFKVPFTKHRARSFLDLPLVEWAVVPTHFGAERQWGVMAHGGARDGWVYAAGVFTGVNSRGVFARGLADVYGQPSPNPSDLRAFQPPAAVHPEVVVRVGHESKDVDALVPSDARGGGLRHAVSLSAAWDARPVRGVDFPLRGAAEVLLQWNHLFLDVVVAVGTFADATGGLGLASVGENVEAGWRFTPTWEVTGRFSRVDVAQAARDDARALAVASKAAAHTPLRWTQEVGLGLNAHVDDRLTWQTDVAWLRSSGDVVADEVRLRTQLAWRF